VTARAVTDRQAVIVTFVLHRFWAVQVVNRVLRGTSYSLVQTLLPDPTSTHTDKMVYVSVCVSLCVCNLFQLFVNENRRNS